MLGLALRDLGRQGLDRLQHGGRGRLLGDRLDDVGRRDDRPHRTGLGLALEARGDHHQFDGIAQLRLFARTPDDVGIVDHAVVVLHAGVGLDILQNLHHLLVHQGVGVRHRDVQQDILGPRNEVVIQ